MTPPVEVPDDLEAMLDPEEFGVLVTITRTSDPGNPFQVRAIHRVEPRDLSVGGELEVSSSGPELVFRASDVDQVAQGDGVSIPDAGAFRFAERPRAEASGLARARIHRTG